MTNASDAAHFSIKLNLLRVSIKATLLKAYIFNVVTYVVLASKERLKMVQTGVI
jgi:hypothetical protein